MVTNNYLLMHTFLLLLIFAGCFLWYSSSEKVKIQQLPTLAITCLKHKTLSRILGIVLLSLSWGLTMYVQGILSGTLAFGAYIMGFFSLIVLLWPYRYLQWSQLLFVMILAFIFEIIIF